MMDKLPEDWLFATLNRIEEAQSRHASEMRMGFETVRRTQSDHELEDSGVQARVVALEKQLNASSDFKRSAQMLAVSTGLLAIWEGVKHLSGWR